MVVYLAMPEKTDTDRHQSRCLKCQIRTCRYTETLTSITLSPRVFFTSQKNAHILRLLTTPSADFGTMRQPHKSSKSDRHKKKACENRLQAPSKPRPCDVSLRDFTNRSHLTMTIPLQKADDPLLNAWQRSRKKPATCYPSPCRRNCISMAPLYCCWWDWGCTDLLPYWIRLNKCFSAASGDNWEKC